MTQLLLLLQRGKGNRVFWQLSHRNEHQGLDRPPRLSELSNNKTLRNWTFRVSVGTRRWNLKTKQRKVTSWFAQTIGNSEEMNTGNDKGYEVFRKMTSNTNKCVPVWWKRAVIHFKMTHKAFQQYAKAPHPQCTFFYDQLLPLCPQTHTYFTHTCHNTSMQPKGARRGRGNMGRSESTIKTIRNLICAASCF